MARRKPKHRAEPEVNPTRRGVLFGGLTGAVVLTVSMLSRSNAQAGNHLKQDDSTATEIIERVTDDDVVENHRLTTSVSPVEKPTSWSTTHPTTQAPKPVNKWVRPAPKPNISKRRQILDIGRSLFGVRYVYGGNSPKYGMDCSAYTRWVYAKVGLYLPRVADDQFRAMIQTSSPLPGDLVFFFRHGLAHHVGIYIGNGMMYNAPHSGTVIREDAVHAETHRFARHPKMG